MRDVHITGQTVLTIFQFLIQYTLISGQTPANQMAGIQVNDQIVNV